MRKRVISLLLSLTVLLSNASLAFAEETKIITGEEILDTEQSVDLSLEKGCTYVVSLPKSIELEDNTDTYVKAGVYAELSSDKMLVVEPENVESFKLTNNEGGELEFDVIKIKSNFIYGDEDLCESVDDTTLEENLVDICYIPAEEIPSGKWTGELSVHIAVEDNKVFGIDITDTSNSTDLNGKGSIITGDTKDTLLNELINSGYIESIDSVNILIDVDCDMFEDTATATFSVKNIAKPGDRIVIYHYDEQSSEWEYIDTVVVDSDYKISCEFSSFSPVGLSNIGQVDESHEHDYIESLVRESSCTINGLKKFVCNCGDIYTEVVTPAHSYTESITTAATCTANGVKTFSCSCGDVYTSTIPKLGHSITSSGKCSKCSYIQYTDFTLTASNRSQAGVATSGFVTIPETFVYQNKYYKITAIGYAAFQGCTGITGVSIPSSVTSLGQNVFDGCTNLSSVTIPTSVKSIGSFSFNNTPWLTTQHNKKQLIILGDGVLFDGLSVSGTVTIPTTVKTISEHAFWGNSSVTNVAIPYTVKSIGRAAFAYCTGLKSVSNSSQITLFDEYVFQNCTALTSMIINSTAKRINKYAFLNCTSLSSVTFATTETWKVDGTTTINSSLLSNKSTAATYLTTTYVNNILVRE